MLYLYCKRISPQNGDLPLSDYRKEKLRHIQNPQLRSQMLTAEYLLNRAVKETFPEARFPLRIRVTETGKPFLSDIPLFISLSHSGDYAACAAASYEIGLDIQRIKPCSQTLVRRYFSEAEQAYIQNSPDPDYAFTELWVMKESCLKASGAGIAGLSTASLIPEEDGVHARDYPHARFWTTRIDDYAAAVCALHGQEAKPDRICLEE